MTKLRSLMLILLLAAPAWACKAPICGDGVKSMNSTFSVYVRYDDAPLTGSHVTISGESGVIAEATTGSDGAPNFTSLPDGKYFVSADYMGVPAEGSQCIRISANAGQGKVRLNWGQRVSHVRSLSGTLVGTKSSQLLLRSANDNREFLTVTDRNGKFDFGSLPAGTYLLRIQDRGDWPAIIRVDPSARRAQLRGSVAVFRCLGLSEIR